MTKIKDIYSLIIFSLFFIPLAFGVFKHFSLLSVYKSIKHGQESKKVWNAIKSIAPVTIFCALIVICVALVSGISFKSSLLISLALMSMSLLHSLYFHIHATYHIRKLRSLESQQP